MDKSKEEKKKKLIWLKTDYVSLVDFGANRGGRDHYFSTKRDDKLEKVVPESDASDEDKRKFQKDRSKRYGIEALEKDANLSYPSDSPTTEALYGDPVNLKYPLAKTDNVKDPDRIRNAIARFKQAHDTYTEDSSKARVYERIVRTALAEKIEVSYNPNDTIDKLLPSELKDRLSKQEDVESTKGNNVKQDEEPTAKIDDQQAKWLVNMRRRMDALSLQERLQKLEAKRSPEVEPPSSKVELNDRIDELTKKSEEAEAREAELKKENERIKAKLGALKGQIGTSFAIRPGSTTVNVETSEKNDDIVTWEDDMGDPVEATKTAPIRS